jgi:hypothetical protein
MHCGCWRINTGDDVPVCRCADVPMWVSSVIASVAKQSLVRKRYADMPIPASRDKSCECADACPDPAKRGDGCGCADVAIHHSQFTIHHSQFTIHHSKFTIHHSKKNPGTEIDDQGSGIA